MKKYLIKSKKSGKYLVEKDYRYLVECEKKDASKFTKSQKDYMLSNNDDLECEEVK